jgi:hypothetical protein
LEIPAALNVAASSSTVAVFALTVPEDVAWLAPAELLEADGADGAAAVEGLVVAFEPLEPEQAAASDATRRIAGSRRRVGAGSVMGELQ